jgi:hypothetical protein
LGPDFGHKFHAENQSLKPTFRKSFSGWKGYFWKAIIFPFQNTTCFWNEKIIMATGEKAEQSWKTITGKKRGSENRHKKAPNF